MPSFLPSIDELNPLYCPRLPASAYLKSLRHRLARRSQKSHRRQDLFQSFARELERSAREPPGITKFGETDAEWIVGSVVNAVNLPPSSSPLQSPLKKNLAASSPIQLHLSRRGRRPSRQLGPPKPVLAKERKRLFSDFDGPPQHLKSLLSINDSSFDVEVRPEKLRYQDGADSSPPRPFSLPPGLVDCEGGEVGLAKLLDFAVPGVRLRDRLLALPSKTPQNYLDFLVDNGYINETILDVFSRLRIDRIAFPASNSSIDGLNLLADNMYRAFTKPGGFKFLSELSFRGTRLQDSDISHIHHLPKLAILYLDDSGIGNEAVFLLVALKQTLTRLSLSANAEINDDAVPAIILLFNLSFLSILDTSIGMAGLRRLAEIIFKESRAIDIEIPYACETYVDNIEREYLFNPLPPLIKNPHACAQLTIVALKRNLEAHASCNPAISATGTREEMIDRLSELLKIRELDVLVKDLLQGDGNPPV